MRVVNDRRSSTRVTVRGEALVYASHGPLCCRCLDISPSGMSVVSPQAVKPRQRVRIESSFKGQRLVLEAVVVRRSRSREGHVLGLRFEGLDPRAHQQLAELLRTMQVQAALAMQSVSFVERLPMLQLPEPEPEPRTEKTPVMARAPAVAVPMQPPYAAAPSPGPAQTGATLLPYATVPSPGPAQTGATLLPYATVPSAASPPRPRVATPGGTQKMPIVGGADEQPWMGAPQPSAATPVLVVPHEPVVSPPRPRIATPGRPRVATPTGTQEVPAIGSPRPRVATPSGTQKMPALPSLGSDSTVVTPPSPNMGVRKAARKAAPSGGPRRVGLEEGWTEEELVTTHYRPSEGSDADADVDVIEAPDDVDCTEVEATSGTITVTEARVPDWEPGAPVALAELVDTDAGSRMVPPSDGVRVDGVLADDVLATLELDDASPLAGLDRTMLTPRPALASFTITSSADDDDDDDAWHRGPARTGKTMMFNVKDLIAAYAPLAEPELDLPEPTAPITAPTTMPRLSDELQAALDRLRRREATAAATAAATGANAATGVEAHVEKESTEEPAPRPTTGTRRHRRPGVTQAYATPRREDTQVRALYHAALANLGDSERGDGS